MVELSDEPRFLKNTFAQLFSRILLFAIATLLPHLSFWFRSLLGTMGLFRLSSLVLFSLGALSALATGVRLVLSGTFSPVAHALPSPRTQGQALDRT